MITSALIDMRSVWAKVISDIDAAFRPVAVKAFLLSGSNDVANGFNLKCIR